MHAVILQHTESSPPGSSIEWLKSRKISYEILWSEKILNWPPLDNFELLIVCGGEMNVDEEALYPWLKAEKKFLKSAILKKKKIMGLCLGAQLLAEVLGAEVKKHPAWEFGWHEVNLQNQKLTVFEYHAYSFSLPLNAKRIASNVQCSEQAFSIDDHIIGCQFHPEITSTMAADFASGEGLPTTGFSQSSRQILDGIALYQTGVQVWYFEQLDQLIDA